MLSSDDSFDSARVVYTDRGHRFDSSSLFVSLSSDLSILVFMIV